MMEQLRKVCILVMKKNYIVNFVNQQAVCNLMSNIQNQTGIQSSIVKLLYSLNNSIPK